MTTPVLRVSPVSLRALAQRCSVLSGHVTPALPTTAVPRWQSSGAASNTVNTGASAAAAAMRTRMTADSTKLAAAADEYVAMDNEGAAALTAVPQRDAGLPPLAPLSGTDGGAGAAGMGE
ncbi:hypothetical protein [Mycobacterium sp. UM_WGJ]|uniref:hypothetical protein n=1 Tax=Mycobacterium sp. UM_WGJ TaxID=1370120 RepID=UPI00041B19EE|nr:hypothetical protein [Mycobacterium sp. UM_WGJ]